MAPPSTPTSHPWRHLAVLAAVIVAMLLGVVGANAFAPADWHKDFKVGRGLDLSSGTQVTLQAVPAQKGEKASPAAMTKAIQIMTNRVEATGLTGATVVQQGPDQIVVSVPGAGAQKVAKLVGTTALLRLRQVLLVANNYTTPAQTPTPSTSPSASATPKASASPNSTASPGASASPSTSQSPAAAPSPSASASKGPKPVLSTTANGSGLASALTPATVRLFDKVNCSDKNWKTTLYGDNPSVWDAANKQTVACLNGVKYAMAPAVVQGKDLTNVQAQDQPTGWAVTFNVKGDAARNLGQLTQTMVSQDYRSANPNQQTLDLLAVVLDGDLQGQPPQVTGAISTAGQINGGTGNGFTQAQANQLTDVLKYGSLPLSFKNLYTSSVSPQLGTDQLTAGLIAACVGLLLVVLYSFIYYRGLGVVSVSSLIIAAALSYLSVVLLTKYESFTLTLAGVAGLIVAIGITADSFVVFFERLRDEVRDGRSLRAAVERGWNRARRTILVSDTVSFLAALLLYILSVGDVRGFAFTLGMTTLIDVVVVFLFTKPMITLLARTKFYGQGHKLSGLDPARLGARAPFRASRRPATRGVTAASRPSTDTREA